MEVNTPDGVMTSRVLLLLCSVDLPAQAPLRNAKQYNGAYGCAYCEDEGTPRPENRMIRNWPMKVPSCKLRTHTSILDNTKEALATKTTV